MKKQMALGGSGGGWWDERSAFRQFLPQLVVTVINNLLLMDLSMMLAFPTLVIGALYLSPEEDPGGLRLDQEQASWLGSVVYLAQPVGALASGAATEPLGRRWAMLAVNGPPLLGWLALRFAPSVAALFAANALLGLSIGFMEAPVLCYVGEISQPQRRALLTAFTGVMAQAGYLLVYVLGATMAWRDAAAVCAAVPVASFLAMLLVPESPLWLLSRGRDEEAERALRWLRGWVPPHAVQEELRELAAYADYVRRQPRAQGCLGRARELWRPQTRRPLLLVVAFFAVFHASGMSGVRPYLVHVTHAFALPLDPHVATVATAALGLVATALLMATVGRWGKRRLALVSVGGCAAACATLAAYASFSSSSSSSSPSWVALTALVALSFFTYFGVGQIPWMYVAEVFPLRSRGVASGVTAAAAYLLYFAAAKTYLQLEQALGLAGVFAAYAACGAAGLLFLGLRLPDTDAKTLRQVEEVFEQGAAPSKAEAADPLPHPHSAVTHM